MICDIKEVQTLATTPLSLSFGSNYEKSTKQENTKGQNWTLNKEFKSLFISIFCHIYRSNVIPSIRHGITLSHGPGSRVKKNKIIHGGTSDFWIDITEYFKNPKFQNRAIRGF